MAGSLGCVINFRAPSSVHKSTRSAPCLNTIARWHQTRGDYLSVGEIRFNRSSKYRGHSTRSAGSKVSPQNDENSDEAEKRRLWMAAIKPPMYSVGIVPVLVAAAAVFAEFGVIAWTRCMGLVLAAIFVIAWLNLSNDAFDAATGVDKTKRESIVNITGNRTAVLCLANILLVLGVGLLATLIFSPVGDSRSAFLLAASIICGYVYQGPPFRLSYKGVGEFLCFFAFGPFATPAFYLALLPRSLQTATAGQAVITPLVWVVSVLVGITTTIILFCSHFHQIEGDAAAGKQSPLVRLGTERGTKVLKVMTLLPYLLTVGFSIWTLLLPHMGLIPLTMLPAALLSLPAAMALIQFAEENHKVPALIAPLKVYGTKFHMAFGAALVLGLSASRLAGYS